MTSLYTECQFVSTNNSAVFLETKENRPTFYIICFNGGVILNGNSKRGDILGQALVCSGNLILNVFELLKMDSLGVI